MIITQDHINFMLKRKGGAIARIGAGLIPDVSIHDLINAQVPQKRSLALGNTMHILCSARKRGDMMRLLKSMAMDPRTTINPRRRQSTCRKWLRRITQQNRLCVI